MGKGLLQALSQNQGSILQGVGTLGKGFSAQKQAEANAQVDRANAALAIEESKRRAFEIQRRGRQAAGQEKVRAAGSGFTQEGTSLQLQIDQLEAAEFNALEELRVGRAAEQRHLQSASLNVQRGKVAKRTSVLDTLGVGVQALGKSKAKKIDASN